MAERDTEQHARGSVSVTRRVEIGQLTFRVLSTRTGGAPRRVFVLVHGIGVSHRYLARLHGELAQAYDVYSIDLPGFGGLPKPRAQVTVPDMAKALAVLLNELGLAGCVLVGHSMGAQWVIELAVGHPDLASEVIVIGPVSDDRHRTVMAQAVALTIDTAGEPLDGNMMVFLDYLRCGPRWYLQQLRQMIAYPIESRVGLLACPLLIIRGGDDSIAGQEWTRRLRDDARWGSLVIVPRHRHLVQYTAPRAVASAIVAFIADRDIAASDRIRRGTRERQRR